MGIGGHNLTIFPRRLMYFKMQNFPNFVEVMLHIYIILNNNSVVLGAPVIKHIISAFNI